MNNDNTEGMQSSSESGSEGAPASSTETVTTVGVDYSEQLDNLVECQYWTFCLLAVFIGLFISFGMVSVLKTYFR